MSVEWWCEGGGCGQLQRQKLQEEMEKQQINIDTMINYNRSENNNKNEIRNTFYTLLFSMYVLVVAQTNLQTNSVML